MAVKDKFNIIPPVTRTHRGKKIREVISTPEWVNFIDSITTGPARVAVISAGMEGRPDLISNSSYGTPDYWWLICAANNIIDPFEQLVAGKQIKVPIIS
jgi:hypothetical protein